ncbi:hypothetical protein [Phenylobacterium sp.]|uniref:hypothetical protein n=1 Tax=Phenylobacterium sp. TaxID=1871053 RepID=UPI0025D233CA|nr:hypothetical protein [Phenylobacterium sp.]MCA6349569.1 hypothetical protein [Phenylobacterium sp.]
MNTARILDFPRDRVRSPAPATSPRLVLLHAGEVRDYDSPDEFEAQVLAMLVKEGWTPPPQAAAGASSPPVAETGGPGPQAPARPWPPVQDFLIVAFALAAVFLALRSGL